MKWPTPHIEPKGGWALDGQLLVSPDGERYGPDNLLTTKQVAEIRGTSVGYIIVAARRGTIKSTKFGFQLAITAADALKVKVKGRKKRPA